MNQSAPATALTLYGIPNCDTVRKARAWLTAQGVQVTFHDLRKQGVPADALDQWMARLGWERLVNRSGTTWRHLDDATRAAVTNPASARALMLAQPSVVKRPVVAWMDGSLTAGFRADQFEAQLKAQKIPESAPDHP